MIATIILFAGIVTGPPEKLDGAAPIFLSRDDLFPKALYLVKAEALTPTSLRVIYVYVGPPELNGKSCVRCWAIRSFVQE